MAFRGSSDKLYAVNNGKFLGLVQLLAKFDPIMLNHVTLALKGYISDHYCGKTIQNEMIDIMASKLTNIIISKALKSTYYSIIADCTPDVSHKEQLSLTIRIVNISEYPIKINEHFLGFFNVNDTTGLGLTEIIIGALKDFGLNISFCRGQGYDNGANMKGKKIVLQKRILDLNPLAFYLPCGSHSLNLVICDTAQSSLNSINVFGIIQRLFTLFSASTSRWNVLLSHTTNFTLKRLCDTRWEAIIERLKAIRYQISKLCKQLQEKLTVNTKSEINGALLCDELISVQFFIKDKLSNVENEINTKEMTPLFILNFIKKHCLQKLYSNTWIVLRILLTIPVTVASGERSFSKLKLIKTYLRNTMLQDRLNSLSMLSIEQEIAENLDFSSLIRDFADKNARKVTF
ncbi:zinc finger MYM-type protein 1-like [Hydra vulgaris]|uniref:Zinc finger MYM-type protein 1-like n=1 Tax=Hydra vulgaris TaxID=6087 RepID=A0ABM4B9J4_HYDVU